MLPDTLKASGPALITALIVCWFSAYPMGALLLLDASPFVLFWLLWNLGQLVRRRLPLPVFLLKAGGWALGVVVVALLHHGYATAARARGDALLAQVQQFRQQQGRFPRDLAELGMARTPARHDLPYYDDSNGQPLLFYRDTAMPFASYSFDFTRQRWGHDSD